MTVARAEYLTAFEDILTLDITTCTVEVCIAAQPAYADASTPQFRRLQLSQPLRDDFRKLAATFLAEYRRAQQDKSLALLQFEAGSQITGNQVEHINLSQSPYDSIVKQTQPLTIVESVEDFHPEPSFTQSMRFYVIILRTPRNKSIYFYRRYGNSRMLQQSSSFAIFSTDNSYEFKKVDTPVFLFDQHIDCISSDNNLFIFAKGHFYYMFTILDDLIKSSKDALNRIHSFVPIVNFDSFRLACINEKHKQRMTKIMGIAKRPYLDKLTIAATKPIIIKHSLHIPIEIVNGQEMLRFDHEHPNDILKMLDDDYLTSIMTGIDYEVDAKRDP